MFRWMFPVAATAFALLPVTAAFGAALSCAGTQPNWSVDVTGDRAQVRFRGLDAPFTIPHRATALNDPEVTAYTMIGETVTAILIVTPGQCNSSDLSAHLLTQDRSTPVLLTGCCVRE